MDSSNAHNPIKEPGTPSLQIDNSDFTVVEMKGVSCTSVNEQGNKKNINVTPVNDSLESHTAENATNISRPIVVRIEENNEKGQCLMLESQKKLYQCHTCGKTFNKTSQLVVHTRTHTGSTFLNIY